MLTTAQITQNPEAIKQLTGIPADTALDMLQRAQDMYPEYRRKILQQRNRTRAVGGGRKPTALLARLLAVLIYIRLHIPQRVIAVLIQDCSQSRLSKDIPLLVPLLHEVAPIPDLWEPVEEQEEIQQRLDCSRVIVDGMEQPVYRSIAARTMTPKGFIIQGKRSST